MPTQRQREAVRPSKISIELQTTLAHIPRVPRSSTGNSCSAHVAENEPAGAIDPWIALVLLTHASLHVKAQGCEPEAGCANKKRCIRKHNKPTQLGFYIEKPATSGGVFHRQQVFLQTTVRELRGWY
jgi:hypothetical protein